MVELNSDIMKTIQSLQANLQSFRDDNLNERKEQQAINEALGRQYFQLREKHPKICYQCNVPKN